MSEIKTLTAILRASVHGPAWHGPCVVDVLAGVTAIEAAARPLPNAHSMWEILLHMEVWQRLALDASRGDLLPEPPPHIDWPQVGATDQPAWQAAIDQFTSTADALVDEVRQWDDDRLREVVAGREYNFKVLLHGVAHHNLYHAGQIALLKKA